MRTTHFVFSARRPGPALAGLFVLGLLPAAPLAAQGLYNQGETISVSAGAVLSVPNGYEQTTGATAFSQWTVFGDAANVQPVELLPFGATRAGSAARRTWATASEKNSAYFEVEASLSGHDFRPVAAIGRVAAQGTSAVRHEYAALDPDLGRYGAGIVYYRLRQTDRDGAVSLSDVRALRVGEAGAPLTAVAWPDPSGPGAASQLALTLPTAEPVELTLYDAVDCAMRRAELTPATTEALLVPLPSGAGRQRAGHRHLRAARAPGNKPDHPAGGARLRWRPSGRAATSGADLLPFALTRPIKLDPNIGTTHPPELTSM